MKKNGGTRQVNSRWIQAKFPGVCAKCHRCFDKEEPILFDIQTRWCFCERCGEAQIAPLNGKKQIVNEGEPCRHCGTPVEIKFATEKRRKAAKKKNSYYYEYFFRCPNKKCKAQYLVENAKRYPTGATERDKHLGDVPTMLDRLSDLEACRPILGALNL